MRRRAARPTRRRRPIARRRCDEAPIVSPSRLASEPATAVQTAGRQLVCPGTYAPRQRFHRKCAPGCERGRGCAVGRACSAPAAGGGGRERHRGRLAPFTPSVDLVHVGGTSVLMLSVQVAAMGHKGFGAEAPPPPGREGWRLNARRGASILLVWEGLQSRRLRFRSRRSGTRASGLKPLPQLPARGAKARVSMQSLRPDAQHGAAASPVWEGLQSRRFRFRARRSDTRASGLKPRPQLPARGAKACVSMQSLRPDAQHGAAASSMWEGLQSRRFRFRSRRSGTRASGLKPLPQAPARAAWTSPRCCARSARIRFAGAANERR